MNISGISGLTAIYAIQMFNTVVCGVVKGHQLNVTDFDVCL